MTKSGYLPDEGQISVLLATSLLAYTLTRYVNLPPREISLQLPGFYLSLKVTFDMLISILVAGLTAAGTHWLIRSHPYLGNQSVWQHIWLPALAAWAISTLLHGIPSSRLIWWALLGCGGIFLLAVLIAEYISVDPQNTYYPLASISLIAVAFSLFAALTLLWRANGMRLVLLAIAIAPATALISLRALTLRLNEKNVTWETLAIAVVGLHVTAALHYWPLSPAQFSILITGAVYAFTSLAINIRETKPSRRSVLEPLILLAILWGAALWIA